MGKHFAKNIVSWENSWIERRVIPDGKRGKNTKIWPLLNDESVKLTVGAAVDKEKESMYILSAFFHRPAREFAGDQQF